MSIAEMQRNKWKRNSENLCTAMPFLRLQMSASKASAGYFFVNIQTGWPNVQPYAGLHTPETGKHQDQVKFLIERTASSLDNSALKMLFVSVQQNNIELCIQYAIDEYVIFTLLRRFEVDYFQLDQQDWGHSYCLSSSSQSKSLCKVEIIQEHMMWNTVLWFGHSFVSDHLIH